MTQEPRTELIPLRQLSRSFDVVLRGYDRSQVHEIVERLEAEARIASADRDAAVSRASDLAKQLRAAHDKIESLLARVSELEKPAPEAISERLGRMLKLAEEEAKEIREAAQRKSEELQAHDEQVTAEIAKKVADAQQHSSQLVSDAELHATDIVAQAKAEQERLTAEAEAERQQTTTEFETALRIRREEEDATHATRQATSIEEAEHVVSAAKAEAERITTEATAHAEGEIANARAYADRLVHDATVVADELGGIRSRVINQLGDLRSVLDQVPQLLGMTKSEREAAPYSGWAETTTEEDTHVTTTSKGEGSNLTTAETHSGDADAATGETPHNTPAPPE